MFFNNLRVFSSYSIGVGVGYPSAFMSEALSLSHDGWALTDIMDLSGALSAYKASQSSKMPDGSKFPLVLGCNAFIAENKKHRDSENKYSRLMLFAKNQKGFVKLSRFLALAGTEEYEYYRPRIDLSELLSNTSDLVCSTGCVASMFAKSILERTGKEEELLLKFKEAFGQDLYVEIVAYDSSMRWNKDLQKFIEEENKQAIVNVRMLELAQKHGIKAYLSAPAYMPKKELKGAQDVVISSVTKNSEKFHDTLCYLSKEEMIAHAMRVSGISERDVIVSLMENTKEITDKCKGLKFDFQPIIPKIDVESHQLFKNEDVRSRLKEIGEKYKDRFLGYIINHVAPKESDLMLVLLLLVNNRKVDFENEKHLERVEYDIFTNQRNGITKLIGYYLPLSDLIENIIDVKDELGAIEERGLGRGSAAASMINYGLNITDIDPEVHDLDPRRFLSVERVGSVDIEIEGFPKPRVKDI